MLYKIRPKSGTKTQWETANPVLAEREIGYEYAVGGLGTGLVKMKMGDGATAWNDLPYAQENDSIAEVNRKTDFIVVKSSSPATQVLGTGQNPQTDGSYSPTIPGGYKIVGVMSTFPTGTGSSGVVTYAYYDESDGLIHFRINNTRTTTATITVGVWVLCQHE